MYKQIQRSKTQDNTKSHRNLINVTETRSEQSKLDHPEILATLESQDTTRRQAKQKTKHHTKHHTEN